MNRCYKSKIYKRASSRGVCVEAVFPVYFYTSALEYLVSFPDYDILSSLTDDVVINRQDGIFDWVYSLSCLACNEKVFSRYFIA